MAERTRFSYRRIRKILRRVRLGLCYRDAAALAGISEARIDAFREERPRFRRLLRWAEAQGVADRLDTLRFATPWQAASWWLERKRSEEFGRRTPDEAALGQIRPDSPMAIWEARGANGYGDPAILEESRP